MNAKRVLVFLLLCVVFTTVSLARQSGHTLTDGWSAYEKGFATKLGEGRGGSAALYCESNNPEGAFGALNKVALDQKEAAAFLVSAWSRCEDVNGSADDGYSLYLDLEYQDGGHLWGTIAPFACGAHDWQERHLRILPIKPVKTAFVYVLFRRHTGRAWFSDVTIANLDDGASFDFQPIAPPENTHEGWYVRDVAANSGLVPADGAKSLGLQLVVGGTGPVSRVKVTDERGGDRALTLYYCKPVPAKGGKWWNTIRSSKVIRDAECATLTSASSGVNGLASLYPFAAVTKNDVGEMLATTPANGPGIDRLFFHPASQLLCAAFDVALTPINRFQPSSATVEVFHRSIDPVWGLRSAATLYAEACPKAYPNRIANPGIWMPFTDPAKIPHPEDFGFSVHEGDESVASDAKLNILSFRYTEPMTWWMNMAPAIPRTYEDALKILQQNLHGSDLHLQGLAQAVLTSATFGADGKMNVSFQNQPWANGAVWILNPNPAMPKPEGMSNQADVVFNLDQAKARYGATLLSGEYLDSLEAHGEVLDYRKESLEASHYPLSFDDAQHPVVPQGYSTYEIARSMSEWLHDHGKLLFANSTPISTACYMPLLDCAGTETNWMSGDDWSPDGDDLFCYRRTLAYQRPYMLLQNTDFSKFGPKQVALYFKKCLFYDVFPSFFSADASSNPYWENPALYERDRPVFRKMIPLFQALAKAGWAPITRAHTSDPAVLIERYGEKMWTVFNEGAVGKSFTITLDDAGSALAMTDLVTGDRTELETTGKNATWHGVLKPGDCLVLKLL